MARWLPILACLAAAAGPARGKGPDLARIVRKVERRFVAKLVVLARNAELAGLHATAARVRGRVLEIDPDHRLARAGLGFLRRKGRWVRAKGFSAGKDEDKRFVAQYGKHLALLEEEHVKEVVRVSNRYGTPEEKRRVIHPLLAKTPLRADLHEALGHEKIGTDYVRPELVATVRALPRRLAAWRRCGALEAPVKESAFRVPVPGLSPSPPFYATGGIVLASTMDREAVHACVRSVARTRALLAELLGADAETWDPPPLLFLQAKSYRRLVRALHPDDKAYKLYVKYDNYEHRDFYAIRVWSAADAAERYAHGAGYLTMHGATAAPKQERRAPAWLLEGFGYLMALELCNRGHVSYVSIYESSAKRNFTRPPPRAKTRPACLKWVREQILAGFAYRLEEVCAMSLNSLDFCASMQAYSFVRFLFLHDPAGARLLPVALRTQRSRPALEQVFETSFLDLARLWRIFVLEISAGTGR